MDEYGVFRSSHGAFAWSLLSGVIGVPSENGLRLGSRHLGIRRIRLHGLHDRTTFLHSRTYPGAYALCKFLAREVFIGRVRYIRSLIL